MVVMGLVWFFKKSIHLLETHTERFMGEIIGCPGLLQNNLGGRVRRDVDEARRAMS